MPEGDKRKPRKFGRGEPHKSNVLNFVKALLLLANGDLKLDGSPPQASVQVEWVEDNQLKVTGEYKEKTQRREKVFTGTTKPALWQLVQKTDNPLKVPHQLQRVNSLNTTEKQQDDVVRNVFNYLESLDILKHENSGNNPYWILTLTLKSKKASIEENLAVVKQKLGLEASSITENITGESWRNCCHKMLPPNLSSNPLLSGDGVILKIEDIVPLDLAERKQRPKQKGDFSPEKFYEPASSEYETDIEHKHFFEEVLQKGISQKSQGKKIAIIGEPGAGKSTLLQQIANWIYDAGDLPIFIKLADMQGKNIEEYLFADWLKIATGKRRITDEIEKEFDEQFDTGRVWLLLDGIDELGISGNLISNIAEQIKFWENKARIIITCRINVWEANKNDLDSQFDTYRTKELSYPDMVYEFIDNFFNKADNSTAGEKLKNKLEQSPQRIRDLVKNPLRLTLLCRTWKRREGELPQTKAELYRQFVNTFYEWKDQPEIDSHERPLLEKALGELAKKALDDKETKFRLNESFIRAELNQFDKSFFDLACQAGLINKWGIKAGNSEEPVYAFLHPTFQEYFAALAIDDWDFFLPREHDNNNPQPVSDRYRIFEPQWKEVILLWLGRDNVNKHEKEKFIKSMVEFKDGCGGFYLVSGIFMSAASLAEFSDFQDLIFPDRILDYIVNLAFGYYDVKQNFCHNSLPILAQKAWSVIQETDRSKAIEHITRLLSAHNDILNELFPDEEEIYRPIISGYHGILLNFIQEVSLRLLILEEDNLEAIKSLNYLFQNFLFIDIAVHPWAGDLEDVKIMNKTLKSYISSGYIKSCDSVNNFGSSVHSMLNIGHKNHETLAIQ